MTPMNGANSGIVMTWLSNVVRAEPRPMPTRATPMGRPMASTDPKATIRMTMANARPSSSAVGSSKSAKMNPPSSMVSPSISGDSSRIVSRISAARVKSLSSGSSTLA